MEYLTFKALIILLPLLFLAGVVDSIGGGGGLISLPAFLLAGLPIHMALGTTKMQSTCGTAMATLRFIKNRFVSFKLAFPAVIAAFLGASIGAKLMMFLGEDQLHKIMIIILPVAAFLVLNKKFFDSATSDELIINKKTYITVTISAFLVGIYDGMYGPGTGTFLILAFTVFAKMNVQFANGHAKIINLASNITALIIFLLNGKIIIPLGLLGALASMAGNYVGSGLALKNAQKFTRPCILFVLCILAAKILFI
ncbi:MULTISPECIES: TSUP family transporter [Peptoniphilus]|uniref:sulfite exporter TauE/SafE family protein n=1 Tax=Peptoniphilus TaxID=162289 RepID=UPI0001DA9A19|nr:MULTISPECIES: TSUP family transporter [Peptoniphilus]EFI41843.1 hypothetical protein HMPREF0629_00472 [Peptoniphilus sp. oral taxon 386 str. F0131]